MIEAWHFTGDKLRDGRPLPEVGEWLVHDGPVKVCFSGLHASRRILDALGYAPGSIIHRVECDEIVEEHEDKLVCCKRKILWTVDGEDLLRDFTRRCALDVVDKWDAPDIVVRWLKTGDPETREAAHSVAGKTQNRRLTQMVVAAHRKAKGEGDD